jgi:hypothetical protein
MWPAGNVIVLSSLEGNILWKWRLHRRKQSIVQCMMTNSVSECSGSSVNVTGKKNPPHRKSIFAWCEQFETSAREIIPVSSRSWWNLAACERGLWARPRKPSCRCSRELPQPGVFFGSVISCRRQSFWSPVTNTSATTYDLQVKFKEVGVCLYHHCGHEW